nr:metal-dependent hydrolase [Planctomycetales bacterium]NIM08624.1 metal-dependent hydrolase [Planctomycetales bacterium]NIN08092.1 metal-dependent hydrolase [Planctomycetales bacterium]NIN77226.1 metal-dependent hydrolase [Planctomycetales bacterium]NIO35354.1 metal-dependent hydrolase [Planctomycetales bacterium]
FHEPQGELPLASCLLATGLCSIGGMLPDLDSDSGIPLRETVAFTAAVVPMLLIHRLSHLGLSPEMMVIVGGLLYLLIRFGFFAMLKRYTVHRGMFHSIPAALIAAELAFLLCSYETAAIRYYKAGAVLLGFMSHLVLDELWSIEWKRGRWQLKKSFGTAMKLWGSDRFANLSTYAKLAVLGFLAMADPVVMERIETRMRQADELPRTAIEKVETIWR